MKALQLAVGLLMSVSLLMVSWIIAEEYYFANISDTVSNMLSAPDELYTPAGTNEALDTNKDLAVGINFSYSTADSSSYQTSVNDPYIDKQWALDQIQVPSLWQVTRGDPEILIAVLDTGIDGDHEDLIGKVVVDINFTDSPTSDDIHGHGTHIAGIIVASINNGIGVAGLAPENRIMNVKVADDNGQCQAAVVARGIIWAVDNGADVINISLELKEPSSELENAVNYAWIRGVVVVAAAGNNGGDRPTYPAYYENSIAVAATREDGTLAPLSNYGDWVDLAAPGFNIYSTLPDNSYGYKNGTSFATAYVSGMAALLFSTVTDINSDGRLNDEIRAALEAGCNEIGINGVGAGRISAIGSLTRIGDTL